MEQKKIPVLNDKFELAVLRKVLKKSIWIIIILIILSIIFSKLYIRYTQSKYKSFSIIQISKNNLNTDEALGIKSVYENYGMSQVIELMRSKEFLKRTLNKLPLQISYYSKGTFLSSELYKICPFEVTVQVINSQIYNIPIFITFLNEQSYSLSYQINDIENNNTCQVDKPCSTKDYELSLKINDYKKISSQQQNFKNNSYFFIINNPDKLISDYTSKLEIKVLNDAAQTIHIEFVDNNAKKTTDIVNAIAEEYLKYEVEKKTESADNIIKFIDKQILLVTKEISDDEKNIMIFNNQNHISTNKVKSSYISTFGPSKVNELENEINKIDLDLLAYKRFVEKISEDKEINIIELFALIPEISTNSTVVNIYNNIQNLINQKEQLLNDITTNNRQIILIEKQIVSQRNILLKFIEISKDRLEDERSDYQKKIAEYDKKMVGDSDYNTLELAKLNRIYSIHQSYYGTLVDKKAQNMISQAGYVAENVILEKSIVPVEPVFPIKSTIMIICLLASTLISFVIVIIKYILHNEIVNASDIIAYSEAPLIGIVPQYMHKESSLQLLINKDLKSTFSESFRTIRSNLDFISFEGKSKIFAITSTISGEGKTFIAINLAGIIAILGKKVLLIDFDLRKPRIHTCFGFDNNKGISTILIRQNSIEECIRKTELENLDFISSGPLPPNPSELIMKNNFNDILEKFKELYDVIVIDTSPIGIVTDALELLMIADCPIYVSKANYSKRTFLNNANHLIKAKNITKLTIILNGIIINKSNYYYGYGYGYSYGFGYRYGYGNNYGSGKGYGNGYYTDFYTNKKKKFLRSLFGFFKM